MTESLESMGAHRGLLLGLLCVVGGCSTTIGDVTGPHPEPVRADQRPASVVDVPEMVIIVQLGEEGDDLSSAIAELSRVYSTVQVLEKPPEILGGWAEMDAYLRAMLEEFEIEDSVDRLVVIGGSAPTDEEVKSAGPAMETVTDASDGLIIVAPCEDLGADAARADGDLAALVVDATQRVSAEPKADLHRGAAGCLGVAEAIDSFEQGDDSGLTFASLPESVDSAP